MKKLLLSMSLGLLVAGGVQAQTLYSEDFNATTGTSVPTGWTVTPASADSWKSGTAQSLSSSSFGFPENDGRLVAINDDGAGQSANNSDALLASKAYDLTGQTGVYLAVDIFYMDQTYGGSQESLSIEASTDGGNTWTVISTVAANVQYYWETRYIDLSAYSGMSNVMIGFRYSDGGGWLYGAALDNFKLFIPAAHDIELTAASPEAGSSASYNTVGSQVTISGAVFNAGTSPITSYTVNYQQGSNPVVSTTITGTINPFEADTFGSINYTIPAVGNYPINVWVTLSGDNNALNDSADVMAVGVPFMPVKQVVFEEGTGTWCGWCPRGAVGMDELAAQFPNAATQIAVHNSDPMEISAYDNYLGNFINGYPSIVVDRKLLADPGDIIDLYNAHKDDFGYATVEIDSVSISGTTVTVPVTITPAVDINNAKISLVITESNIRHEDESNPPSSADTAWMQHNYYSPNMPGGPNSGGTIQLPLTGFDHASEYVDGMYYHFVARAATPSPEGGSVAGLPTTMTAGATYNVTLTGTLDASWSQDDLQYAVLLIASDSSIMNSATTETPALKPILQDTVVAISNVVMGINKMELYPNPAMGSDVTLAFDMAAQTDVRIQVVDVTGKVVYTTNSNLQKGNNSVQLPVAQLSSGTYFVTAATEKGSSTIKFVVAK